MDVILSKHCGFLAHASQIYTGFQALSVSGKLSLGKDAGLRGKSFGPLSQDSWRKAPGVFAVVDGRRFFFDVRDQIKIEDDIAENVEFYFKRSFSQQGYQQSNIFPLGLNYEVYSDCPDAGQISRYFEAHYNPGSSWVEKIHVYLHAFGIGFLPREKNFLSGDFTESSAPKILFLARTWDPLESDSRLSDPDREERQNLNDKRATIIRSLREVYGERFCGGFSASQHSYEAYPDLVVENRRLTRKKSYLNILKSVPICISTAGLHGSIGWKFSEYVALGRAIVSEKSDIVTPHGFESGNNFLDFESVEECIEMTQRLVSDEGFLAAMMARNREYFYQYLCPEKMIESAIRTAKESAQWALRETF